MNHLFYESGLPIVEYNGKFIVDGNIESLQTTQEDVEQNDYMAFRRSIGTGLHNKNPFLPIQVGSGTFKNGAYECQDGYLPNQLKTIYKKVSAKIANENFVVFEKETNTHFCIRQVCSLCEHHDSCNPELEIVEESQHSIVVSMDISAQEPTILSIRSKEPNWISTFRNKHLRVTGVLNYIEPMFASKYGFDVNNMSDMKALSYWEFISQFDWNTDRLNSINELILAYTNNGTFSEELDNQLSSLFQDYEEYLSSKYKS